eukprot:gene21151-25404_t
MEDRDFIPLLDLKQRYGAPVQHYIALVESFIVNGSRVRTPRPIYAMIDTGSSGLYITENMYYDLQREARGWRSAEVAFTTKQGNRISMKAARPNPLFLCLPASFPWLPEESAYLIVVGIAFLENTVLTLDADESKMLLEVPAS